jgi:anti-sigma factor RsiW
MTPDEELPDRERRVAQILRQASATERAPASLRAEIESLRAGQQRSRQRRRSGSSARRPWASSGVRLRIATVTALPLAALALALILIISGGGPPTIGQTASLATRSAVQAAPAVEPTAPGLLTANVQKLHFPDWQAQGGWSSTGTREDSVGGRAVTTVYYRHAGTQIAYSIVAKPALGGSNPTGSHHYRPFKRDGRDFIVWTESGHTCLLSSNRLNSDQLWALVQGKTV